MTVYGFDLFVNLSARRKNCRKERAKACRSRSIRRLHWRPIRLHFQLSNQAFESQLLAGNERTVIFADRSLTCSAFLPVTGIGYECSSFGSILSICSFICCSVCIWTTASCTWTFIWNSVQRIPTAITSVISTMWSEHQISLRVYLCGVHVLLRTMLHCSR